MKKTTTLRFSTKFINRNYRLKVSGVDSFGNRINKLVGVTDGTVMLTPSASSSPTSG